MSWTGGNNFTIPLSINDQWAGFDLVKVGGQTPTTFRGGDILLLSGCITTTTPMKNQAGWDLTIAQVDPRNCPPRPIPFLAPTAMSRYEGIYQCGTSMLLKTDGKLTINFPKSSNPMVLHFCGLACVLDDGRQEPIPLPIAQYELRDWMWQHKVQKGGDNAIWALEAEEMAPPGFRLIGNIVFLQGLLKEATFGPISQYVCTLPEKLRPQRELRWLANLLRGEEDVVEHSVALTLRTDGTISVQGGKVHMVDAKGQLRVLQTKKKGRLCFDGVRFSLLKGTPVQLASHISEQAASDANSGVPGKSKVAYLLADGGGDAKSTAFCIREQRDLIILEGYLTWQSTKPPNSKQPIGQLPKGAWPHYRQTFFTRGGSDLQERRRVDVDQYGRVFCPEGAGGGRVELTGILFVAAPASDKKPRDNDWDELQLQYHRNEVNVVSSSFEGCDLLEQFVRACNYSDWSFIEYDFGRHAGRKMLLPLGQVPLKGNYKYDPMAIGKDHRTWQEYKGKLYDQYGIMSFHTLLHVSDVMFDRIAAGVGMELSTHRYLTQRRNKTRQQWAAQRPLGMTYSHLHSVAEEIVDQMFQHWDFKAQLLGALQSDFRPPATIEHLFPQRRYGQDHFIKRHVKEQDMPKFEEVRQFFYLYETTGSNMTHCSLMGSSDVFTTTGKWYFPDAQDVQQQLFENIAWLFPRGMYLYMSERQTSRFPFIEDLDVQAKTDWQVLPPGEKPRPPDDLLMNFPTRTNGVVGGDPGQMMRKRAHAIHMIYPQIDALECLVYSASGYNKGKDMLKSSFHLVWPQLIVDPDRAPVIRHVTLGLFQKETLKPASFLGHLQDRLLQLHESNNWELVFDSTTINARNGLRLPYNDKASMVIESEEEKRAVKENRLSKTKARKKRVREERPSAAVGKIRFTFDKDPETGQDIVTSAKWVADKDSYSIAQWIGMGSCRRDPNSADRAELTPWELGQDVLAMLPTKPGEQFYFEGEADGEGGHWVTHKPFPHIRRCPNMDTERFKQQFNDFLSDEQDALKEEQKMDMVRHTVGSWVSVTEKQAVWRSGSFNQCEAKVPDKLWGNKRMQRPTEVVFLREKGKVILDGPTDVVETLIRAMKPFTKPDDNAVMPIYDVTRISH